MPEQIHKLTEKIVFLVTSMGYGTELLYWGPILSRFVSNAPNTRIYLTQGKHIDAYPSLPVRESIRTFRISKRAASADAYNRIITLIKPSIIRDVWLHKPDVVVLSEFGMLTLYGIVTSWLRPRCRVLLLVESDPGPLGKIRTPVRRFMCRHVDTILTNNHAGEQYLLDTLRVSRRKILVMPYLVSHPGNTEGQDVSDAGEISIHPFFSGPHLKLLYVGQLARRKGLGTFIRAVAALAPQYRDQLQVALVGSGDAEEHARLRGILDANGIANSFHFFGRRNYSELAHFYRNSDAFVMPTLNDYRALVGFEAISYHLPVLISKYDGACHEVVDNDSNGFIFDPLNEQDFSAKLAWFIDNRNRLKELSRQSARVASKFTVEIASENLQSAVEYCMRTTPA